MLDPKERKILCLNNIADVGLKKFRKGYSITENINEAAGILVRSADMLNMDFPEGLRAVARAGAGVNNIPIEKCSESGIVVFNTPGANANSVKELVLAGLFLASRDIYNGIKWVNENSSKADISKLAEKAKKNFAGHEISGKTLGVIGLGAIGVRVANAAVSLGMNVLGYDPYLSLRSAWMLSPAIKHADTAEEVYAASDFITIHVPAMESTKKMINAEAVSKMKKGIKILNFARDVLVDEEALKEALTSGQVAKYISDFPNSISANLPNSIILPHLGASTEEAEDNCAVMAAVQLQDYLDNGNITNSVNFPELNAGVCGAEARVEILHRNVPNMLSQITSFFGKNNLNIENLLNRAKGQYACTLLDISHKMPDDTTERLKEIDGVLRVRRVKERS